MKNCAFHKQKFVSSFKTNPPDFAAMGAKLYAYFPENVSFGYDNYPIELSVIFSRK